MTWKLYILLFTVSVLANSLAVTAYAKDSFTMNLAHIDRQDIARVYKYPSMVSAPKTYSGFLPETQTSKASPITWFHEVVIGVTAMVISFEALFLLSVIILSKIPTQKITAWIQLYIPLRLRRQRELI